MLRSLLKISLSSLVTRKSIINTRHPGILLWSQRFANAATAIWPNEVETVLQRMNIVSPTKIQELTIDSIMANKDLVGIARTGSGKTLAFVIPLVSKILRDRNERNFPIKGPSCLVLCPTRELALQTHNVFEKFQPLISSIALFGGTSARTQLNQLRDESFDVFVATPGRLKDFISRGNSINFSNVTHLVLDEADRILDMGFEPDIRRIVEKLPKDRQTIMWSATWPEEVRTIAGDFMKDFEHITLEGDILKANPNIKQIFKHCTERVKFEQLKDYLQQLIAENQEAKILIFANTRRMVMNLQLNLMRHRINSLMMHGQMNQTQRQRALEHFKLNKVGVLVATDVAGRGLDIDDITHVVNYDLPPAIEDYVHRIGRTARLEKKGEAISFITFRDIHMVPKLIQVLRDARQPIPDALLSLRRG